MKKIIIIGSTGSGKSTLAKALSKKLGYPYVQLDLLFWKADWQNCDDDEFFEKIKSATNCDAWIVDGNYTRSNHLTWPYADTVVWIDLPFYQTLYQNITRSIKRAITNEELWPNSNNRESFSRMFSSDSIVLWLLKTYKKNVEKYEAYMNDEKFKHIKFYRLRSRGEIDRFINEAKSL